jgi:hypothetical protein
MDKKVTVSFYDACLPDYFSGHHKPVLQYPVEGSTTRNELYNGLLSELAQGVINYEIDENQLNYDAIREAIKECLFFKPECKDNDILFPDLELWTDDNDNCESCYAFFVVDWEETE